MVVLARVLGYDAQALAGLQDTHGERLLFKLQREWWGVQDRPRFLHRDSSHGYTESHTIALSGAEAVPEKYQEQITVEARKNFLLLSHESASGRRDRLRRVESVAKKRGLDISSHLAAIEARIRMIESELDQAA